MQVQAQADGCLLPSSLLEEALPSFQETEAPSPRQQPSMLELTPFAGTCDVQCLSVDLTKSSKAEMGFVVYPGSAHAWCHAWPLVGNRFISIKTLRFSCLVAPTVKQ